MGSAHLNPVIIREGGVVSRPERRFLGSRVDHGQQRERHIQTLIHDHPDVIPMAEIEGSYDGMRSACTELRLAAGYLDNLWITPFGGIVLGECKLFRNPQARREVIAQALDYVQSMQGMAYDEFERRIAEARKEPGFSLWAFARAGATGDEIRDLSGEADFIDGVSRRLRDGRVMVLVIGDGIHEGVESLAEFLQLHAGIHASMALVDLSLWALDDGSTLVVPRLPMKTATIVRGIVEIAGNFPAAVVIAPTARAASGSKPARAASGSEIEYFTELDSRDPAAGPVVSELCDTLPPVTGLLPRFSPQYVHFDLGLPEGRKSILSIRLDGEVWGGSILSGAQGQPFAQTLRSLLDELAEVVDARASVRDVGHHTFLRRGGGRTNAATLAGRTTAIADIVRRMVEVIAKSDDAAE